MKYLVTGANGYLGTGVIKQLLNDGQQVIAASKNATNISENILQITGDIFASDDPFNTYGCPDVVVHFAWKDVFKHNSSYHIDSLAQHYEFLRNMAQGGVKRIAVMGSSHEIGFFEGCVKPDTPCNPISLYGIGKNAMRGMLQQLALEYNFTPIWLRGFSTVGNESARESVYSKMLKADKDGIESFPFVKGDNKQDYTEYNAFCTMIAAAVEQDEVGGIIQICSGVPTALLQTAEQFIKDNNLNICLNKGAFPDRPYDSREMWGNNDVIKKIMSNYAMINN